MAVVGMGVDFGVLAQAPRTVLGVVVGFMAFRWAR